MLIGDRLGPYEILEKLGEGGMGEVYRAHDPRLRRDVALKVLPELAVADPDRRERFTREAHAVAALNHPHIVTIYSVEDTGTAVFLTMELVEGRSLADVLSSGGLSLDRVLAVGIAVAEAMAAAHHKGITHRDLKPGNIMLGEGAQSGRIKVLDFGLAKIAAPPLETPSGSMPPSAPTTQLTAEGRILGTVAYMSPEQAEGRPTDGRSDLFSLGVVLYEMATGRRPFTGDTSLSILSAILKDTPPSITELNPALPADLGRIVRRALAKDPERRYQTAKDLRNDLEDLKASVESSVTLDRPATPATPISAPASDSQLVFALARKHRSVLAAAMVAIAVTAALAVYLGRDRSPASNSAPATPSVLADLEITQLTTSGNAGRPAISPDGRYVAYVQRDRDESSLWIRQTDTTSNVQIVPNQPGTTVVGATFTPDATSIDFVRQTRREPGEVWRVPFLGGTPTLLIRDVASAISWAPDGQRIAFLRSRLTPRLTTQLIVAAADGRQERILTSDTESGVIVSLLAPWQPNIPPAWSPDGRLIAVNQAIFKAGGRILVVDSQTGATQEIAIPSGASSGLSWLDPGSLVVNLPTQLGATSQLFRVSYPAGQLSRLTNDPNDYIGVSVTRERTSLVTGRQDARSSIWVGDATGSAGAEAIQSTQSTVPRFAWLGDQVLYGAVVGGRPAIMRASPGGGAPEAVMVDALTPGVTSDGRTIAFVASAADNQLSLWTADASGRRMVQLAPVVTASSVVVTPDDRSVLYSSLVGGTVSIWMVPIEGGTPVKLTNGAGVAVSPDGGSIAFTTQTADGPSSLVVCNLPGCASPRAVGAAPFDAPIAWMPDGRSVAFALDGNLWAQRLGGGSPRQLTRFTTNRPIASFAWSRDGKRLAILRVTATHDVVLLRGLK